MKTATLSAIVAALLASAAPLRAQTATVNVNADARVLSGAGNTNYGSQDVLSLHHSSGNVQRTFVNFDLTGYAGVSLTSDAVLTLRASGSGGTALTGVNLGTANAAWAENTITWNNQPGITVVPGVTNPNGTYAHNSDVTWTIPWYVVEKWATTGYHGIGLTSGMNSGRHFLSKEGGVAPKLEFAYADSQDGVWIGGAGNWSDAGNWQDGIVARGIDRSATFHGFGSATVTVDADRTIGSLSFDNADHTIAAGAGRFALSTTAGSPTIFVGAGRTATIAAPILGMDGLAKTGAGTLNLTGVNAYTGGTTVSTGTLAVTDAGRIQNTSSIAIEPGATFRYAPSAAHTFDRPISGAGTLRMQYSGGDNYFVNSSLAGFTGDVIIESGTGWIRPNASFSSTGASVHLESGARVNLNGNLSWGEFSGASGALVGSSGGSARTLTFGHLNTDATYAGTFNGVPITLVKEGTGTQTFSAAHNRGTGATIINAGVMEFTAGNAMDNARGAWTVNAGATLRAAVAQNVYGGLNLNGGTVEGIGAHSHMWGHFVLQGNVTVGGSQTSVISGAIRVASNADRTFTVNPTGDPSGIDLDIVGNFSHAHDNSWGFMTKAGDGTMRFAPTSSGNIGRITVNAGTVLFDDVIQGMTNGGLINNAGGTVEVRQGSGVNVAFGHRVQGAGTFIKSGPGTFRFNGGNQLIAQGQFLIQEGTLQNDNNSVNWSGNTGNIDISAGAILDLYADPIYVNNLTGSGIVQNNWGNASGQSGSAPFYERLIVGVAGGSSTFDGTIRDNATGAPLGSGAGGGGIELEKRGAGTFTLRGANAYTGQTAVLGGTLALDYSLQNNSKLSDTAPLVLGNATLNLAGGSYTEAVGSTTLLAGTYSAVTRTGGASVLQMGAITREAGAFLDVSHSGIATTSTPNDAGGILGPWATIGRADWAANSTGGPNGLITAPAYTDVARRSSGPQTIAHDPAANVRIVEGAGTAGNITLGAPVTTIHTLNQSASGGGSAATLDPAGQTLAVNAILQGAGAGPLTIGTGSNNGTLRTATPGGDLFLTNQSASPMTIRSAIADHGGPSSLTKVGGGPVVLAGANTYTGDTTVLDGGALRIGGAGQLGGGNYAGTVHLTTPGSRLDYASSANQTLSGSVRGSGELLVSGPGTLTMSGASSYAGATTISGGTLRLAAPSTTAPSAPAGLVVHLDATQIAQASGSNVTTWPPAVGPATSPSPAVRSRPSIRKATC